ncbi:MATE family efflux transporter, partial [bacterium]|nr:MATE family efflux transporter [bacterium]
AISLAAAITNCLTMFGIGILASISSILANYRGEGKDAKTYFFPTLKFAAILAVITCTAILLCIPIIDNIGFEPKLVPMIKDYFFITAFATFGGYLHCMAKEFLQSFEIVIFPNLVSIFSIFLNLILNIIFVFGWWGIPEMGAVGLALSSFFVRFFMGIVVYIYAIKKLKVGTNRDYNYFKDLLKVGMPSSVAIMIEFIGFNAISVILGRVAGIYAAAHNILTTLTSVSFMIPFSISIATSVKVGYSNGAKNYNDLKIYAKSGLCMCVGIMLISALIIGLCPEFLVNLFTIDMELVKTCLPVVTILCYFQVFDGLQVALSGIFRGLKKTYLVMISNFIGYWLISFPLGYYLGIYRRMYLEGFWLGIIVAATVLCGIMLSLLYKDFKKLEA